MLTKIVVTKGGKGSGHFRHAGRPGQIGGSSPGISISLPKLTGAKLYDDYDLKREEEDAIKAANEAGAVGFRMNPIADKFGEYEGHETTPAYVSWHEVPGGWEKYHPKAIHNGKVLIAEFSGYSPAFVTDRIAADYIRGISTTDEVIESLRKWKKLQVSKGGSGSGDFGHHGIPGHQGGSAPGKGAVVSRFASGLKSKMPKSKQDWYRSWAKNDFGFEGQIDFEGSAPGSSVMGYYDPDSNHIVLTDAAEKSGKGVSALAHETSHAKFDEVMTAMVNDDRRTTTFSSIWDRNEKALLKEGKHLTFSLYARSFWKSLELGDDLDLAINETFAEFARMGRSDKGKKWIIDDVGVNSSIWKLYQEFQKVYGELHE